MTTAMHYVNGTWNNGPNLLMDDWADGEDIDQPLNRLGFRIWLEMGVGDFPTSEIAITVYERQASPQFLIDLEGRAGSYSNHIYAQTLPDVMDLLARWAPVAQAGAITNLIRRIDDCDLTKVTDLRSFLKALQAAT